MWRFRDPDGKEDIGSKFTTSVACHVSMFRGGISIILYRVNSLLPGFSDWHDPF